MAAFGCLRVCERVAELRGSRLSWTGGGVAHAVLWTPAEIGREGLVTALVNDVQNAANRPELTWNDQIKTAAASQFRTKAEEVLKAATMDRREAADWFSAFGSELESDEGKIEATPFDMSVARQRFLADALRLAAGLVQEPKGRGVKTAPESYAEALFGPWKYQDDQHSLGWDPSTMKLGAFTYKAPTAMANSGVRAAVWLAFESLPLFPCFSNAGLKVRAFRQQKRDTMLCWPVWSAPISLDTLTTLLGWPVLVADTATPEQAKELEARGVTAIYRSARFKPNKYLASFRSPELVFGGRMAASELGA